MSAWEGGTTLTVSRSHDFSTDKRATPSPTTSKKKLISWSTGHHMDYFTEKGVILRTGYQNKRDWYLLTIKELFDNAIDFFWEHYAGAPGDTAKITASITITDSHFHLTVRNSNPDNKPVPFTKEELSNILDFRMRYGTKQNKYNISRGILGDALKQTVAFPYVMQDINNRKKQSQTGGGSTANQWKIPIYFRANGIERQVTVDLDFATEEATAVITENPKAKLQHTDTEIELTYPIVHEVQEAYTYEKMLSLLDLHNFCRQYMIFTTDVSFMIVVTDKRSEDTSYNKDKRMMKFHAKALHNITPNWVNKSSVYYYTLDEFRRTLLRVHNPEEITILDILKEVFQKEVTQLSPKRADLNVTIAYLINDPDRETKIEKLYQELRAVMKPPKELSLPYSHISRKERKQYLIDRLTEIYGGYPSYDTSRAVYKVVNRQVKTEEVEYPYTFEIITIPRTPEKLIESSEKRGVVLPADFVVGAVNYTVSPKPNFFNGHYGAFPVMVKDKKAPDGKVIHHWIHESDADSRVNTIGSALEEYGFSFSMSGYSAHQKLPCLIAANLVSPKINYHGHDKAAINATPFTKAIIQAIDETVNDNDNIRTLTGAGIQLVDKKRGREVAATSKLNPNKPSIARVINHVIGADCRKVSAAKAEGRPIRIGRERTQMSIWYNGLPWWKEYEVPPEHMPKRKSFITVIPKVTAHYGLKREEVGIVASPWASMFYQDRWYAVTYKDIAELSMKGTDIIFIEKQDIVGALGVYASRVGVALVNTRGHLVEYAKDLARLAQNKGGNIGIFTDYDIPGIHIASKLKGVIWLGVDERMLRHFHISHTAEGVVDYQPKKKLKESTIREILKDGRFSNRDIVDIEFLKKNKVEIDAVLAYLNDQAKPIWDYLQSLLEKEYPNRNYLRAISKRPTHLTRYYPSIIRKLLSYIKKLENDATEEEAQSIENELKDVKGFIVVKDKIEEIDKRHTKRIKNYKPFNDLAASLEQLDSDRGFGIKDTEEDEESIHAQDYVKKEERGGVEDEG